ncbi:MAG TPA: chemotaxis protein CheW [Anaeromyxobacteraceae bacterium]|nr:chemotaxis protein CheW [Anaeromyxobacteraceae bacterium]
MAMREERGSGAPDPAPRAPAGAAEPDAWYFSVRIAGGRYALPAPLVTEVVRLGPLTRLPSSPSFLPGVFTHRGEILPVLDLGELLLRRGTPPRPGARAAIVHAEPWRVAVLSDEIEGLIRVPRRRVGPPPAAQGAAEFLQAVVLDDVGDIAVLDMGRVVSVARSRSVPS